MEQPQQPNPNPFASSWGASGIGTGANARFRQSTQEARNFWQAKVQSAPLPQRVIGTLILILLLGLGIVLSLLFIVVGVIAAVSIATLLLIRKAANIITGNSRNAINRAKGTDNDGRRNVTVVER